jgi:hypothetical protein
MRRPGHTGGPPPAVLTADAVPAAGVVPPSGVFPAAVREPVVAICQAPDRPAGSGPLDERE